MATNPTGDDERLSALIGDIYDAALDGALWQETLRSARNFVGGSAAALYAKDANSKNGDVYHDDGGIEAGYTQLYFEKYIKLDPSTTGHLFAEIDEPLATADFIPYDEFLTTRFYKEWARPQRLVDHVTTVLEKSMTSVALFGVFRHERDGIVSDETRRRMRLIAPHMRRAVLVARMIDLNATQTAAFADTLDGLAAGMFLVGENGRIVHANVAGLSLLADGDLLRASGGRLTVDDLQGDQKLREIVTAATGGDAAVGVRGIALPLSARSGQQYVAHVLPLTSGARRSVGIHYAAVVALFVHQATLTAPSPPEVIAQAHKLTPTELRVLLAIVEVGGVPEVAEALGIAETTVKTHLGRLYEKTGTHRQADLVKLLAGYSGPLRS